MFQLKQSARILSNVLTFLALLGLTVIGIEFLSRGELVVYFLSLLVTILTRKTPHREWFYFGLLAYDVIYLLPLIAYHVLGWRDM